jgi:hypothetical protein
MSGRLSVPLVISGALAGLFVMAGVAFASHPFGALNNTGNTASTGFRVPMGAASKPCRAADQGGAPDSTHSGVPGDSCSGSGASRLTSNLVKPGPKQIAWVFLGVRSNPRDVTLQVNMTDVQCRTAHAASNCSGAGDDYNPNTAAGPYTTPGSGHSTPPKPPCTSLASCFAGADMTETAEIPLTQFSGVGAGMPVNPGPVTEVRSVADRAFQASDHNNARNTAAACNTQGSPPPNCQATTQGEPFPVPVICTPTADPTVGSSCGNNTTANSLVPGAVVNGKRGVIEIGQVQIYDSGNNGLRNYGTGGGTGDDRIAVRQGITIP